MVLIFIGRLEQIIFFDDLICKISIFLLLDIIFQSFQLFFFSFFRHSFSFARLKLADFCSYFFSLRRIVQMTCTYIVVIAAKTNKLFSIDTFIMISSAASNAGITFRFCWFRISSIAIKAIMCWTSEIFGWLFCIS